MILGKRLDNFNLFSMFTQHSLEDLVVPWQQSHYIPRRERYVQKKTEFTPEVFFFAHLPNFSCRGQQLVIVNPH